MPATNPARVSEQHRQILSRQTMAPPYSKPTATKTSVLTGSTTMVILSGLLVPAPFRQSGTSLRAHPTPKPTSGSLPATSAMPSPIQPCAKDNMLAFDNEGTRLADVCWDIGRMKGRWLRLWNMQRWLWRVEFGYALITDQANLLPKRLGSCPLCTYPAQ